MIPPPMMGNILRGGGMFCAKWKFYFRVFCHIVDTGILLVKESILTSICNFLGYCGRRHRLLYGEGY
jgi:hypothetical protein